MSEHLPPGGGKPPSHDSDEALPDGNRALVVPGRDPDEDPGERTAGSFDDAATSREGADASSGASDDGPAAVAGSSPMGTRGWPGLASVLAVALALLATTIAGFLWWQYRQFYVALHTVDTEMEASLERMRANDRSIEDQLSDLGEAAEASRERGDLLAASLQDLPRRLAAMESDLDELPNRLSLMERQIDAARGGSSDARTAWIMAEAEYYLTVANAELELAGHWENAVTALELADNRLRAVSNPALGAVREQIADELLALDSIDLPDIEGLVFGLSRLAERADELPLRLSAPTRYEEGGESLDDAEPGLGRLLLGIERALRGIISIERSEEPIEQALSPERRSLAKRELVTELQLARVAALREQPEAFEASLRAATAILERDFDTASAAVEGAQALLRELLAVDIAPQRPDISGSLSLLRSLPSGTN